MPNITIPAGITIISVNPIEIVDDTVVENNEVFTISLSYPDYVDGGNSTNATVTIMDNDRKCISNAMGTAIIITH